MPNILLLLFKYWKLLFIQYYPNIPNLKGPKNIVIVRFLRRWWWWEDLRPKSCGYKRKKQKEPKGEKLKATIKMGLTQRKLSFLIFTLLVISITTMAERVPETKPDQSSSSSSSESAVHIVYMERPQDMEPEAFHIQTLASVLGRFFSLS